MSATFYLVFINDLLCEIENSNCGCMLFNLRVFSSVQADDIALMSTTTTGMRVLLNICQKYSETWGFKFSAIKSEILKFQSSRPNVSDINLQLYGEIIPVVTSTKHVGIILHSGFNSTDRTLNACRTLRGTALSVLKSGIHPSLLNPLTCAKIISQTCYPKALFACELWNEL